MIGVANSELFAGADHVNVEAVTRRVIVTPKVIVIAVALLRSERYTLAVAHTNRLQMQRQTWIIPIKIIIINSSQSMFYRKFESMYRRFYQGWTTAVTKLPR